MIANSISSSEQTETMSVLAAHRLAKQVDGPEGSMVILDDLSLELTPGEALAIVGPSGSGKSTLLGLLAGLDDPSSGHVTLLGQNLQEMGEDERAKLRAGSVGFVFQTFHLLQGFTALENVQLALELGGQTDSKEQATILLTELGLGERLQHYPEQLSGGEQQRVALARAFVTRPKLLFADEPTGNLDPENGRKIVDAMFALRESQCASLVLVTHDMALAERCDRKLVIRGGKVSSN